MAKFETIKAGRSAARHISVVVPTLNEAENVDALVGAVLAEASAQLQIELLIADGGSTDGTIERVRAWGKRAPVRLIQSGSGRGLAGDVLAAAREASSEIIVARDDDKGPAQVIGIAAYRPDEEIAHAAQMLIDKHRVSMALKPVLSENSIRLEI